MARVAVAKSLAVCGITNFVVLCVWRSDSRMTQYSCQDQRSDLADVGCHKGGRYYYCVISFALSLSLKLHLFLLIHCTDMCFVVQKQLLLDELYQCGIRVNRKPPNVTITIKDKGGVSFNSTVPQVMRIAHLHIHAPSR